jgi:hypothetical protein
MRSSQQLSAPARVLLLTAALMAAPAMIAEPNGPFITGVNYPWIAYGHDFGRNAWGHDGLITGGWTYQTHFDSRGLTDARFAKTRARSGTGSLGITAKLTGGHPERSKGEVYIDLRTHTPPGASVPVDIRNTTVRCWLYLPKGSAGDPNARNGVQFFFKSEGFRSLYTDYQNIGPDSEERWVQFTADTSDVEHVDAGFDPAKVIIAGIKIGINDESQWSFDGTIFLDDYALDGDPAIRFDFEQLEVEHDFEVLQQALGRCSVPAVRVFVFADGRAAPEFSLDGRVTGLDDVFFDDFDALLETAGRFGLQVIPVLLDFSWFDEARIDNGVQLGGRSPIARDPARRQSFLDNALGPLVDRYCGNPQILAWDVINEPEWATKELPDGFQTTDPVALAEMQEFVRLAAGRIHSCPGQQVTVGSARRMWMHHWRGLGLDLYQFHWYEHFASAEPFPWQTYARLGLDKPALAGEVPTATGLHSASDYLRAAARGNYAGLLLWSYRAGDNASAYANARSMLERWCTASPRRRAVRSGAGSGSAPF